MTAGLRTLLSGCSLIGHPLDFSEYPRVARAADWGLITLLSPKLAVGGSDEQRGRQRKLLNAALLLRGGSQWSENSPALDPPTVVAVIGRIPDPPACVSEGAPEPSALVVCKQLLAAMGKPLPPALRELYLSDDSTEQPSRAQLVRALDAANLKWQVLESGGAAIDQAIEAGQSVILLLHSTTHLQLPHEPDFAIVTASIRSEMSTLGRVVLGGANSGPCLLSNAAFEAALEPRAGFAVQGQVVEADAREQWALPARIRPSAEQSPL